MRASAGALGTLRHPDLLELELQVLEAHRGAGNQTLVLCKPVHISNH